MATEQGKVKKVELNTAIMKVAESYGVVTIRRGIVYTLEPDGTIWSFTVPEREQ